MNAILHILLIVSYGVASGALAALCVHQGYLNTLNASFAGALVFIMCAIIHAGMTGLTLYREVKRRYIFLKQQMVQQAAAMEDMEGRLEDTRDEIHNETRRQSEELMGEVRVLQSLLSQVIENRKGPLHSREQVDGAAEVLDDDRISSIMRNALSENRLDLHVQPIVQLPSRRALHFECFARVRDETGEVIFPNNFLGVAVERGMSGTLDNLILFRCVQMIRKLGHRRPGVKFFCNISAASMSDETFFPQFVEFMLDNRELADRLVFEFDYREALGFSPVVLDDLTRLARRGFRYSLDNVDELDFDMAAMKARHVSFVKIDAGVFLGENTTNIHAADLKAALRRHDIALIVTRIEAEETVVEVLDHSVDYAQGYLFGEPRQSRIETAPAESLEGVG